MLYTATMLRSVLAVAVVTGCLVAGSGAAASAGTYLGLGLGTAADMSASAPDGMVQSSGNGRSGRFLLGWRFGRLSVEGDVGRFGVILRSTRVYDSTQASALLKYSLPLGNNFEAFARGGLQRTWLSPSTSGAGYEEASGNGLQFGLGFEYRLNAVLAGGSVFVDYNRSSASLANDAMTQLDSTFSMWTAGFTVAI